MVVFHVCYFESESLVIHNKYFCVYLGRDTLIFLLGAQSKCNSLETLDGTYTIVINSE